MNNRFTILHILALTLFSILPLGAKDFKVLYISSVDAVSIEGAVLSVGDVFSDKAVLKWKDEKQVMKASDTETQKQYIIPANSLEGKKSFSLSDFFLLAKPLASRNGEYNTLQELSSLFQGQLVIDGSLCIQTAVPQDETHYFYLACQFPCGTINKAIEPHDGVLVISVDSLFRVDGEPVEPFITESSLYYYDAGNETSTAISSGFAIVPVP